jgi:hypothetical protein
MADTPERLHPTTAAEAIAFGLHRTHEDTAALTAQLAQERAMRDRGQHRAQKAQERADTAETPAGIQLAKKAVAPLTDAIRAFLAPSKGAGRRHTAARLLVGVDPELAAYITVRTALGSAAGRRTLRSAAMNLTEYLEAELIADRFESINGALYRAVIRNAEARGLSPSRQMKSVGLANRRFNLVDKPWTQAQRLQPGSKLIELFIESIGIVRCFVQRTAAKSSGPYLEFTPEIDEWMHKYNAAATLTGRCWSSPRASPWVLATAGGPRPTSPGRFWRGATSGPRPASTPATSPTCPSPSTARATACSTTRPCFVTRSAARP